MWTKCGCGWGTQGKWNEDGTGLEKIGRTRLIHCAQYSRVRALGLGFLLVCVCIVVAVGGRAASERSASQVRFSAGTTRVMTSRVDRGAWTRRHYGELGTQRHRHLARLASARRRSRFTIIATNGFGRRALASPRVLCVFSLPLCARSWASAGSARRGREVVRGKRNAGRTEDATNK